METESFDPDVLFRWKPPVPEPWWDLLERALQPGWGRGFRFSFAKGDRCVVAVGESEQRFTLYAYNRLSHPFSYEQFLGSLRYPFVAWDLWTPLDDFLQGRMGEEEFGLIDALPRYPHLLPLPKAWDPYLVEAEQAEVEGRPGFRLEFRTEAQVPVPRVLRVQGYDRERFKVTLLSAPPQGRLGYPQELLEVRWDRIKEVPEVWEAVTRWLTDTATRNARLLKDFRERLPASAWGGTSRTAPSAPSPAE